MLWVPVQVLKAIWPAFLPYAVAVHADAQINELSLELLLLQVILPALLEQSHTRIWLKALMRTWCRAVSWLLDLRSYLLGDEDLNNADNAEAPQPAPVIDPAAGLGAAHQALIHRDDPIGYQPYVKPRFFVFRMIGLLILVAISLVLASLVALTVPVWLGRHGMSLWLVGGPPNAAVSAKSGANVKVQGRVHELYTAACGMYLCWLGARALALLASWLPQGRAAIIAKIKQWLSVGAACLISAVLLLGVIPMLFGLLLEFVVVMPLRVPLEQTPNVFLWQDWALGVLYTKIACAVTMMGPDWSLRRAIEKAYRDGIREIDIFFIIRDLAAPVITSFGLALAVPYVAAHSIAPLFITNKHTLTLITRKIYPFLLLICSVAGIVVFQIKQFKKLYEHIKNDKYLVGQRLVNYDHRRHRNQALTSSN
uniref:RING-type E3 ubiquitin transferase n=1 Tax=Xenopsylla cheopis TaxID=163159 RepID=A0A6M2DY04_XENCH